MMDDLIELRNKALEWVKISKEMDIYEGLKRVLTNLYPSNAHFIYELLQNAEDTESNEVDFNLSETALEFSHNGNRLFTYKDVKSITSISNSTKADDPTSIGKFGIGFKAVFAYTNTPKIHSGDYHFSIHDLIVPEPCTAEIANNQRHKTYFIFPFNNPKKLPAIATNEIEVGLMGLSANCLLFLSHIKTINYRLANGSRGYIKRVDHPDGFIDIYIKHPSENETISHWLHFDKKVEVNNDMGEAITCNIGVAYSLVNEINKKTKESNWKIVPLDQGQVSIYFPAEKESSNLRFHIHAPFASTVARDSVRDCEENRILRDHISKLVVESLSKIRDQNLLAISFLATLPNPSDNLASEARFYLPIQESIVLAFKTEKLTPMRQGGHATADGILKSSADIINVIDDNDLILLINDGRKAPILASNPPQKNQREDKFLDSLDIEEWGLDELLRSIGNCFSQEKQIRIESWLNKKDDAWMMRFYALLASTSKYQRANLLDKSPIIKVSNNLGDKNVIPADAFFPPENKDSVLPAEIFFVKPSVYLDGRASHQKQLSHDFLSAIVQPYDTKASVLKRLAVYDYSNPDVSADHYKDIKLFVSYWKKNTEEIILFKNRDFLLGNSDDELIFGSSSEFYLDEPYQKTGLAELENIHYKIGLWAGYKDKLSKNQIKDFIDFVKAIGVMHDLPISKVAITWNNDFHKFRQACNYAGTSNLGIFNDYNILNLDSYINLNLIGVSRLIWASLIKAEPKIAKAKYRANKSSLVSEGDSQLIHTLKNVAWIPNNKGVFCFPQDMTTEDLLTEFPYDNRNGLLTAIEFGENARKVNEEYKTKNTKAQEIGFESTEEAEIAKKVMDTLYERGISPTDFISHNKRFEQPEEVVANTERRRERLLEKNAISPNRESVKRERSIQPGINLFKAEAKAYLRAKYTNVNNEMICQCCRNEMPFKINGAYYFEAVQCIKNTKHLHTVNNLALCSICSDKYQVARKTKDTEIRNLIVNHSAFDNVSAIEIPIILAGSKHTLRFVGTHWFDLKESLKNM